MKPSDTFPLSVEWSEEDDCYVGRCPGFFYGGVHGDDKDKVYEKLLQVVEDWIELEEADADPRFLEGTEKARRTLNAAKGVRIEGTLTKGDASKATLYPGFRS